jgi:hypothetical protein
MRVRYRWLSMAAQTCAAYLFVTSIAFLLGKLSRFIFRKL